MNKELYFILGAAVGSVFTWLLLKDKYEKVAQEEIDSVKETFKKETERLSNIKVAAEEAMKTYNTIKRDIPEDSSYVIAPYQFGEFPDYNQVCVKYYEDGTIVGDKGDILDDINGITEEDFLEHFGEYEDDSVYYRDDMRCCDYEILRVPGRYEGEDDS